MQLCCVSDWPLHALSWQQSEGGSPGLPAPLNQIASAAPLYCTSTKFDSALPSHLHPAKTSLWPFLPPGCPHKKIGSGIFLVFVTFVFWNQWRRPDSPFFSPLFLFFFLWILIPGEDVGCLLPSPSLFSSLRLPVSRFLSSLIYPLQTNTCAALLSQTSLSLPS